MNNNSDSAWLLYDLIEMLIEMLNETNYKNNYIFGSFSFELEKLSQAESCLQHLLTKKEV